MTGQASLALIYFLGSAAAVALAVRSYDRSNPVALELVGFALCVAQWALFYGLEALADNRQYRELWSQFAYIGTYGSVAFMTRFCIRWLKPRVTGWWMTLLWIVPFLMVVAEFSNPVHGLLWLEIAPAVVPYVYRYSRGPLFWIGAAYQYLLVGVSAALVIAGVVRRRGVYRQQALLVLCGLIVAVAGNIVSVLGLLGPVPVDVTPLGLALAAAFLLVGISRTQLLELTAAARHRLVDVMPDGVIVLDDSLRVVDWNDAMLRLWHIDRKDIMGMPVVDLIPGWRTSVPERPPDSFRVSLEEGDGDLVCHHIDLEMRRLTTRNAPSEGWIVLFHDTTELRAAELSLQDMNTRLESLNRELARQAVHDGLTGLYNRSYLDEALPRELARAARDKSAVGLLILDIDHFKLVNDRYGHGVGDRVLVHVAALVRAQVRAGDIPCRYGGDELVVVMPGSLKEESLRVGQRILDAVANAVFSLDEFKVTLTVSVGIAVYPDDAANATDLFRNSDRALYAAKDGGRNNVVGAEQA